MNSVLYLATLLSVVILFTLLKALMDDATRTTRTGVAVEYACDNIEADPLYSLVDPVLTRDGLLIANLVCRRTLTVSYITVANLVVSRYLTQCPTQPGMETKLNWIRDWTRVKCLSLQDPGAFAQIMNEQILHVPESPRSMTLFYQDRMDPRQYASFAKNRDNLRYRDVTLTDPLDNSWFLAVNTDGEFLVFENIRNIVHRISMNYPQLALGSPDIKPALIGYFCVANSTLAVELRAVTNKYRLFRTIQASSVAAIPDESRVCCVCLDVVNKTSPGVASLSCGHFDHEECLRRWFAEHSSCPECRADDVSVVYR